MPTKALPQAPTGRLPLSPSPTVRNFLCRSLARGVVRKIRRTGLVFDVWIESTTSYTRRGDIEQSNIILISFVKVRVQQLHVCCKESLSFNSALLLTPVLMRIVYVRSTWMISRTRQHQQPFLNSLISAEPFLRFLVKSYFNLEVHAS